jgi:hypothetical protein
VRQDVLQIYSDSNGDKWFLCHDESGRPVVLPATSESSGETVPAWRVGELLSLDRSRQDRVLTAVGELSPLDTRRGLNLNVERGFQNADYHPPVDALLLTSTRVCTFAQQQRLTNASGFFFKRENRLFLVTSRHVVMDMPTQHFPDRLEIELHVDVANLGASVWYSIPLYSGARSLWREGRDSGGEIDVAVIEIELGALPLGAIYHAFTPAHILGPRETLPIGASLLIVGFPLGFHDSLHHLPVVRQGVLASAFGLRFQGKGCFLSDARTHRGTSGAPVVLRAGGSSVSEPPWRLLGIHSSSFDMGTRNLQVDESLGLNSAWYADILMTLCA